MINNRIVKLSVFLLAAGMLFSSCYKKFDASSYAPELSIGGYTSSSEIAPGNLIAYWPFDGTYVDNVSGTSGENTGTTFTGGVKGQAMQGAKDAYVLFDPTNAILSAESFTVTCWVNSPQNTDGMIGLITLSNKSNFWANLDIFFENGSAPDKAVLKMHVFSDGKDAWLGNYEVKNIWNVWTSIALSYDAGSSTFKVFVNGAKIATQEVENYGPVKFENSGKMVFGTEQFQTDPSLTTATGKQDWASYLTGALDEVRMYNTALSEDDISALVKLEGRGK